LSVDATERYSVAVAASSGTASSRRPAAPPRRGVQRHRLVAASSGTASRTGRGPV